MGGWVGCSYGWIDYSNLRGYLLYLYDTLRAFGFLRKQWFYFISPPGLGRYTLHVSFIFCPTGKITISLFSTFEMYDKTVVFKAGGFCCWSNMKGFYEIKSVTSTSQQIFEFFWKRQSYYTFIYYSVFASVYVSVCLCVCVHVCMSVVGKCNGTMSF